MSKVEEAVAMGKAAGEFVRTGGVAAILLIVVVAMGVGMASMAWSTIKLADRYTGTDADKAWSKHEREHAREESVAAERHAEVMNAIGSLRVDVMTRISAHEQLKWHETTGEILNQMRGQLKTTNKNDGGDR